jgi:hypothetical protein
MEKNTSGRIPIIYEIPGSMAQNVYLLCAGVEAFGNADSNILANTGLSPKISNTESR